MVDENIKIGLDSSEFQKGIDDMKKKLRQAEQFFVETGKTIASATKKLLGFGIAGTAAFRALNIEAYKKFRSFVIGLGVSTAKTTGIFQKFIKTAFNILPLWAKWVLGIGAVVAAYKTLRWAITKFNETMLDANKNIEKSTKSLVLVYKGAIIELTKEFDKLRINLSDTEARILQDYDKAVNHFKQSNEALKLWWDLHNPWQVIKRSTTIALADISKSIQDFLAEIPKTAKKMSELQAFLADPFALTTEEKVDNLTKKIRTFGSGIDSIKTGFMSVIAIATNFKEAWLNTFNAVQIAGQTTIDRIIDRFGPFREFFVFLASAEDGVIDNLDDLIEKLDLFGLTVEDLNLISAAMQGIKMTPEQGATLDALLLKIQAIIAAGKEAEGIITVDLPEGKPITPVGPPPGGVSDKEGKKRRKEEEKLAKLQADLRKKAAKDTRDNIVGLLQAAAALNTSAGNIGIAGDLMKAAAFAMQLAAAATAAAALAKAFSAAAEAGSSYFTLPLLALVLGFLAATAAAAATAMSFDKGGFVSKGPGSLPNVPQAQDGLITPSNLSRDGMLVNVHSDELITPLDKLGQIVGVMVQRLFEAKPMPSFAGAGGGGTPINIIINANGAFDSPAFWEEIARDKIRPALRNANYGRRS